MIEETQNKKSNEILLNNRVLNKCYLKYLNILEEEKDFYITKMINEAYRLGYEKGKLSKK